jgi:hypothetical protein
LRQLGGQRPVAQGLLYRSPVARLVVSFKFNQAPGEAPTMYKNGCRQMVGPHIVAHLQCLTRDGPRSAPCTTHSQSECCSASYGLVVSRGSAGRRTRKD